MKVYFAIKENKIIGMSKFPYENTDFVVIEKEIEKEKFSLGVDIFVFENNTIKEVPPPVFDDPS